MNRSKATSIMGAILIALIATLAFIGTSAADILAPRAGAAEAAASRLGPTGLDQGPTFLPIISYRHDPFLKSPVTGIQMYGYTGTSSKYHPYLIASGATWLRAPISWNDIEVTPTVPPTYDWSSADQVLAAARTDSGGLSMIATISQNPSWASSLPNGTINSDAMGSFADFMAAAVERYDGDGLDDAPGSPVVNYWELYNEPDGTAGPNGPHWGYDGTEYAAMLSLIYGPMKAADPNVQVLLGGLAYDFFIEDNGPFYRQFLDEVLSARGGDYFDIMNFHVYPYFWSNWSSHESPSLLEKTTAIRAKLAEYQIYDKPLVVTEAGWHSNDPPPAGGPDYGDYEIQSRYVVELFTQSLAADLDFMIWWMLYDPGGWYPFDNGLVTNEPVPQLKPSFIAYQFAQSQLDTARFQRILPDTPPIPPHLEAYEFKDIIEGRTLYVAWTDPASANNMKSLKVPASVATVRNIYNDASYVVVDGQDGLVDGQVTVSIGGQPVYIEVKW